MLGMQVFDCALPADALDLLSRALCYVPENRLTAIEACAHPFFDELREAAQTGAAILPNGTPLPPIFNFTPEELAGTSTPMREVLIPPFARGSANWSSLLIPPYPVPLLGIDDGVPMLLKSYESVAGAEKAGAEAICEDTNVTGPGKLDKLLAGVVYPERIMLIRAEIAALSASSGTASSSRRTGMPGEAHLASPTAAGHLQHHTTAAHMAKDPRSGSSAASSKVSKLSNQPSSGSQSSLAPSGASVASLGSAQLASPRQASGASAVPGASAAQAQPQKTGSSAFGFGAFSARFSGLGIGKSGLGGGK
jgi:serine/threonine protein kinase